MDSGTGSTENGWHSLPADEAIARLGTDQAGGLSEEEAEQRLGKFGRNEIPSGKKVSPLKLLLEQFTDPLVLILIAAAFYFGRSLLPHDWFTLLLGLALLSLAGLLGGFSRLEPAAAMGARAQKGLAVFVAVGGAFYAWLGVAALNDVRPVPASDRVSAVKSGEPAAREDEGGIAWTWNDEAAALAAARETGRPLLIDFWAEWCAACKELDHKTFGEPTVSNLIAGRFVPLKIDGTKITPAVKAIWARYGVKGLPTVLVLDPRSGAEIARFEAFRTPDQVIPILNGALH